MFLACYGIIVMSADDALLFIDANKYLDLYRTDKGKKLLAPLGEQVDHIFVTQQVVNEVQRNKIEVAAGYLADKFKELKVQTFNVPDHLSGTDAGRSKGILQQMRDIGQKIKTVNEEVDALALGILQQISRSEDEVSKALAPIFARAVPHCPEELVRARNRRRLGNPPGKSTGPLGDQLTWEQILTRFKGRKRLWIISRDGDYGTFFGDKAFLNRFLYDELRKVAAAPDVHLFRETVEGIEHFVNTTGVKAEKRLTPEEAQEIEKEEKSLLRSFWLSDDVLRTIQEVGRLGQPNPETMRLILALAQQWQPDPETVRTIQEVARLSQPDPETLRTIQEVARLSQPDPETLRMVQDLARLAQLDPETARTMVRAALAAQPKPQQEQKEQQPPAPPVNDEAQGVRI
jgi:hypothetical protein